MRVAFVVQRCGREVAGGAELHCLQVAQRMAGHWETEILTTCALDYTSWDNFYPAGAERIGATVVRRFRVDQSRDAKTFDRLSAELQLRVGDSTLAEEEEWMRAQGPMSSALLDYLAAEKHAYDAFVFFSYLYATTYFGLPLVEEKALLAPLAHDEWTMHLKIWDAFFARPKKLIFNTPAERAFLQRRFPQLQLEGTAIGVGIDTPPNVQPERFRERYGLREPFLLYVGRIDAAKGCDLMFEYFLRQQAEHASTLKLILIGNEVLPVPFHENIVHLGKVDDAQKWVAMAACDWLLMPSPHESLSMVLLETWSVGRPSIVNAQAEVLVEHCRSANAGLWHSSYEEWLAILRSIDAPTKDALGQNGRAYVRERYSWKRVECDYLELIPSIAGDVG